MASGSPGARSASSCSTRAWSARRPEPADRAAAAGLPLPARRLNRSCASSRSSAQPRFSPHPARRGATAAGSGSGRGGRVRARSVAKLAGAAPVVVTRIRVVRIDIRSTEGVVRGWREAGLAVSAVESSDARSEDDGR
jgi:hypothetical protein